MVVWVGFELLYRSRQLGISQRRAEWFIRWTKETADLGYVHLTSFEEVGNIIFVASVLEYERPFSGLLYTFTTIHTRISTRLVLAYVSFMLRFCIPSSSRRVVHELFSLSTACHAQASDDRTGFSLTSSVCLLSESHEGQLAVDLSKGWKACVVTSTLEALAVFLARKLQNGEAQLTKGPIVPTWSDNRGNGSALTKLVPTRYWGSALLVKIAAHTKRRRLKAQVEWLPGALRMGLDAERALGRRKVAWNITRQEGEEINADGARKTDLGLPIHGEGCSDHGKGRLWLFLAAPHHSSLRSLSSQIHSMGYLFRSFSFRVSLGTTAGLISSGLYFGWHRHVTNNLRTRLHLSLILITSQKKAIQENIHEIKGLGELETHSKSGLLS